MSDEMDDLRQMFRDEAPIRPRGEARQAAIEAAMARFEQENLRARQGIGFADRLKDRVGALLRNLKGPRSMPSIRLNQALLAGTSLAVLTLVVVGTGALRHVLHKASAPDVAQIDSQRPRAIGTETQSAINQPEAAAKKLADRIAAAAPPELAQVLERQAQGAQPGDRSMMAFDAAASNYATTAANESGALTTAHSVQVTPAYHDQGRDRFQDITPNPVKITKDEPVSTFSIDVDTSSYSFVRAALNQNLLPQKDAVRVEEMINYFPYDYPGPADRAEPFRATATVFPTPWNPDTKLLHIGIKGFALNGQEKPRSNLVFLIDTSGSMNEPNKLPLLINSMKLLVETLGPQDTVSIVTYAGNAGTVLEPTKIKDKAKIIASLDNLQPAGSTAGAEGVRQAYQLAEQSFDRTGVNRVILATDGDFNVGITDPQELKSFVERKRATGIYLSVLGFGRGNYNDELMQTLAQNGNGNAAYIDTLNEARKVLVDEASSTLFPIARDVKIQIEFNPQTVSEYRLIGYETRLLNREDFNNDKVDAGDIGAGHAVTALYEITPRGSKGQLVDDLRYGESEPDKASANEYAFLKIRYKLPDGDTSKLITTPVTTANEVRDASGIPQDTRFATAVAAFGQILRGGQYTGAYSYDDVIALAQGAKGEDPFGYRAEFINLVRIAKTAQTLEQLQ